MHNDLWVCSDETSEQPSKPFIGSDVRIRQLLYMVIQSPSSTSSFSYGLTYQVFLNFRGDE
ncbi:hypothetical protein MTR_6g071440 [Medicago truncatula]|uniref:Uncharacterized protein n=1 Tax=Medicago truncatula TaxID=3880 RepID=G7KHT1_MEDTR|nr:hypothetical protein MTR_6g071440 [Medicago truncatula]